MINLNEIIIEEARSWIGVRYEHRGITKQGCDCGGLIIGILRALGYMKNYKIRRYPNDWNLHVLAGNVMKEEVDKITKVINGAVEVGDLILFNFGKCVSHVGIVIEDNLFIHTHSKGKKCLVSSRVNSPWAKRIVGYRRLDEGRLKIYGL